MAPCRSKHVGCRIADKPVNILIYADDLVFLAPSWFAQQSLLSNCTRAVSNFHMFFNTSNSYAI